MLAQVLAEDPQRVLQALTDMALEMFKVDSAGISLMSEDKSTFFWPALSGSWQGLIGDGVPRNFSPCGNVLDRKAAKSFTRFDQHFDLPAGASRPREALLLTFGIAGREIGTLWLITHGPDRHFDAEDLRQLQSLARFASVANSAVKSAEAIQAHSQQTSLMLDEAVKSSQALTRLHEQFVDSEQRYRNVFEAFDDGFCIIEKVDSLPGGPLDFRYVDANLAFVAYCSMSSVSAIVGRAIRQLFPDVTGTTTKAALCGFTSRRH